MKSANIYEVNTVGKKLTVLAHSVSDVINLLTARTWNQETQIYDEAEFEEKDIIQIKLTIASVICPDYL